MENRRKIHEQLEVVQEGFANGVAEGFPLNDLEKQHMIEDAAEAFGAFLTALKCDWKNDPNSMETPRRVAKAYVNDYGPVDTQQCLLLLHFHQMDMMVLL